MGSPKTHIEHAPCARVDESTKTDAQNFFLPSNKCKQKQFYLLSIPWKLIALVHDGTTMHIHKHTIYTSNAKHITSTPNTINYLTKPNTFDLMAHLYMYIIYIYKCLSISWYGQIKWFSKISWFVDFRSFGKHSFIFNLLFVSPCHLISLIVCSSASSKFTRKNCMRVGWKKKSICARVFFSPPICTRGWRLDG